MRDKFGRRDVSAFFRDGELEPYIVEENSATGVTYICYTDEAMRAIRRVTETVSGDITTTKIEVAFGSWANRGSLTYQPVNRDLGA